MESFYSIVSKEITTKKWNFVVKLNANHKVYEGHFPDIKIVPGVILVGIIKEVVELELNQRIKLTESKSIKFLKMTYPSNNSTIEININVEKIEVMEIKAEIISENGLCLKMFALFETMHSLN